MLVIPSSSSRSSQTIYNRVHRHTVGRAQPCRLLTDQPGVQFNNADQPAARRRPPRHRRGPSPRCIARQSGHRQRRQIWRRWQDGVRPRPRDDNKAGRRRSWQRVAALPGAARGGRGGAGVRRDPSDEFGRRQHLLWRPQQGQAGLPEWQPVRRQGRRLLHPAVHVQKPVPALTIHEHVRAMCDTAGAAIVAN